MNTTYYQPEWKENGEIPEELYSFEVFKSHEDAFNWLIQNDYEPDDFNITEYNGDDIEEPVFIDEYGQPFEKIEDVDEDDLFDIIINEVVFTAGSVDNLLLTRQDGESDQEWEDRLYTEAHDKVMDAIDTIEKTEDFDFTSYWKTDVAWYDSVREDAIRKVMALMTGEEDW